MFLEQLETELTWVFQRLLYAPLKLLALWHMAYQLSPRAPLTSVQVV